MPSLKRAGWRVAIDMIQDGASSNAVLRLLDKHYTTPCSLRTAVSRVHSVYLERHGRPLPVKLAAASDVHKDCKRRSRTNAIKKNAAMLRIDGDALLSYAHSVMERPKDAHMYDLALALLVVTGRRTSEIMNGKSSFLPVRNREHLAVFRGQLKTKRDVAYTIPLLTTLKRVSATFKELRARQARKSPRRTKNNRAVSRKYQSGLRQHALDNAILSKLNKLHDLRGIYAKLAYDNVDWGAARPTLNMAAMRFLGQQDLKDANVYTTYDVATRTKIPIGSWTFS